MGNSINSQSVKADAQHRRSDAITLVLAFIGISIALIGGKGYEGADDWEALIASGIKIYNAIKLLMPALAEIMDAAPDNEIVTEVRELAICSLRLGVLKNVIYAKWVLIIMLIYTLR